MDVKQKEEKTNYWKITAFIFILLFVIETAGFISIINSGLNIIDKENECYYNVCSNYVGGYYYDSIEGLCYCYEDGEEVYEKYIGGK